MLCQKEPQEDGWGVEGGVEGNMGGELGSIPPYLTCIPPGNTKIACRTRNQVRPGVAGAVLQTALKLIH